ncbi:DUF1330 domain-containing protein [Mixta mediterraneensis]|nr:DUF1330 domain-containing protein [Mixta mediterraneensis]MBE5252478.1 DUF1330 domain-containing protein [Mixta mediterraneensis]
MTTTDYQSALQCYHSPEYQRARAEREAVADALITLVDGL